jgi:peroxiredoxin
MENNIVLKAGESAPGFAAADVNGTPVRLADYRGRGQVLVVFLRFAGCPLSRLYLQELRAAHDDFESAGIAVIAVLQSSKENIQKIRVKKFPFIIIPDPEAKLYEIYGVGHADAAGLVHPRVLVRATEATLRGQFHGLEFGDERRLPGAFLVDRRGSLRLAHAGCHIADLPPVRTLLRAADTEAPS